MIMTMNTTSINIASRFYMFQGNIIQTESLPPNAYSSISFLLSSLQTDSIPFFFLTLAFVVPLCFQRATKTLRKEISGKVYKKTELKVYSLFLSLLSHIKCQGRELQITFQQMLFLDLWGLYHNLGIPPKSPLAPSLTNFPLSTFRLFQKKSVCILNFRI